MNKKGNQPSSPHKLASDLRDWAVGGMLWHIPLFPAEVGGSLWVQSQSTLHSKFLASQSYIVRPVSDNNKNKWLCSWQLIACLACVRLWTPSLLERGVGVGLIREIRFPANKVEAAFLMPGPGKRYKGWSYFLSAFSSFSALYSCFLILHMS